MRVGRYELFERIGVGGMAEVFRARAYGAEGFRKDLVLKRILPHLSHDPEFRSMFIDEAKITVALQHANIVQVLDLGQLDDQLFIAMELVEGTDLSRVLRRRRKHFPNVELPLNVVLYIAIEALKGLHYAHTRSGPRVGRDGVVHRDVSPSNIMMSFAGEVKIGDFGIATAAQKKSEHEQEGIVKGKLRYMSVEQLESLPIDGRADVYSMGMVLYQMLSGVHPFTGVPEREMIDRIRAGDLPSLDGIPELDPEFRSILQKAIRHLRKDRFHTAEEFHEALSDYALKQQLRLSARPLSDLMGILFSQEMDAIKAAKETDAILESLEPVVIEVVGDETSNPEGGTSTLRTKPVPNFKPADQLEPPKPPRSRWPMWAGLAGGLTLLGVAAFVVPNIRGNNTNHTTSSPALQSATEDATPGRNFQTGFLSFDIEPWADVWIDGRAVGSTPIRAFELPAGPHTLEFETPDGKRTKRTVQIPAGKTLTVDP